MLFENSHNWDIATQLNGVDLNNRGKGRLVLKSALKRYREGHICMYRTRPEKSGIEIE